MLKYLYLEYIGPNEWKVKSKQILDAAGKYGFTNLNLEADDIGMRRIYKSLQTM